eukprot:gene22361-biopygen5738
MPAPVSCSPRGSSGGRRRGRPREACQMSRSTPAPATVRNGNGHCDGHRATEYSGTGHGDAPGARLAAAGSRAGRAATPISGEIKGDRGGNASATWSSQVLKGALECVPAPCCQCERYKSARRGCRPEVDAMGSASGAL